jgi:hypothetical protein
LKYQISNLIFQKESIMREIKKSVLALACFLVACAYAGLGPSYAEESGAGAPAAAQGGRERATFTHKRKEHAQVSCGVCHSVTPQRVDVNYFPGHTTCISCHNFAAEFFNRGTGFCGVCHSGGPTSRSASALFNFQDKTRLLQSNFGSDFGIDFSHPAHRKPLPADFQIQTIGTPPPGVSEITITAGQGAKCTDCHKLIMPARATGRELSIEKGHSTCFQCHGMKPETGGRANFPYMNDCRECHETDGPRPANLPDIREFRHIDHDYDIRPRKKADYRVKRPEDFLCADCHRSVDQAERLSEIKLPDTGICADCHNGRIGLPDPLAGDILNKLRSSK